MADSDRERARELREMGALGLGSALQACSDVTSTPISFMCSLAVCPLPVCPCTSASPAARPHVRLRTRSILSTRPDGWIRRVLTLSMSRSSPSVVAVFSSLPAAHASSAAPASGPQPRRRLRKRPIPGG